MNAVGVHAHQSLKLGLRPPEPDRPSILLGDFLTGVVPAHPDATDYLTGVQYGLYKNDTYGNCGPVSVANNRRLVTAKLTGQMQAPTLDDVLDLYRRSGNPNFDPRTGRDDNGVVMQVMLQALLKGGIGGVRPVAFAKLNPADIEQLQAAQAIFGAVLYGVDLQQAQQAQTDRGVWDHQPSGEWGGHAVMGGAYRSAPETAEVITWGKRVSMTEPFVRRQTMEAWVVVWPEHLTDRGFLDGVDLAGLAAAYAALTGKPFPAVVPPKPPAPPPPPPAPAGAVTTVADLAARVVTVTTPRGWAVRQVVAGIDRQDIHVTGH